MKENGFTENKAMSMNSKIEFLSTHLADKNSIVKLRQHLITKSKILPEFFQPISSEKSDLIGFSNSII